MFFFAISGLIIYPSCSLKYARYISQIAPDLTAKEVEDIARLALRQGVDGLVISNTTTARPPLVASHQHGAEVPALHHPAILSGNPYMESALRSNGERLKHPHVAATTDLGPTDVAPNMHDACQVRVRVLSVILVWSNHSVGTISCIRHPRVVLRQPYMGVC